MKRNVQDPTKPLSLGYGFVKFARKESADKALKLLQLSDIDGHKIELKRSNRTTELVHLFLVFFQVFYQLESNTWLCVVFITDRIKLNVRQ